MKHNKLDIKRKLPVASWRPPLMKETSHSFDIRSKHAHNHRMSISFFPPYPSQNSSLSVHLKLIQFRRNWADTRSVSLFLARVCFATDRPAGRQAQSETKQTVSIQQSWLTTICRCARSTTATTNNNNREREISHLGRGDKRRAN
jgi:hypothetical protein